MADFIHRFIPGPGKTTLLLLHGTGGDETSLLPLARVVDEGASVLTVRGRVLENGMPRFFRRLAEGVFDENDLRFRAKELSDFVLASSEARGFSPGSVVALGYSNGANIASAMLLLHPETMGGAILLRPMVPFRPSSLPDLAGKSLFISAGSHDGLVSPGETRELEALFRSAGAMVSTNVEDSDHSLTRPELEKARLWLRSLQAKEPRIT